jgi:hypothetical protein
MGPDETWQPSQGSKTMKYFTPDLHTRFCSLDPAVAGPAHAEWEQVLTKYEQRIKKIRSEMSPQVRQLGEQLRLHDADLVCLLRQNNAAILVLRLEPPATDVVLLRYEVLREPVVTADVLPPDVRSSRPQFLYDEVDVIIRKGQKLFTHAILFSNGLEVKLSFRDVQIEMAQPLILRSEAETSSAIPQPA